MIPARREAGAISIASRLVRQEPEGGIAAENGVQIPTVPQIIWVLISSPCQTRLYAKVLVSPHDPFLCTETTHCMHWVQASTC